MTTGTNSARSDSILREAMGESSALKGPRELAHVMIIFGSEYHSGRCRHPAQHRSPARLCKPQHPSIRQRVAGCTGTTFEALVAHLRDLHSPSRTTAGVLRLPPSGSVLSAFSSSFRFSCAALAAAAVSSCMASVRALRVAYAAFCSSICALALPKSVRSVLRLWCCAQNPDASSKKLRKPMT